MDIQTHENENYIDTKWKWALNHQIIIDIGQFLISSCFSFYNFLWPFLSVILPKDKYSMYQPNPNMDLHQKYQNSFDSNWFFVRQPIEKGEILI